MKLIHYFAILSVLMVTIEIGYSTMISGHVTEESHPMLASVLNVADMIRKEQSQTGNVHPGTGSEQGSLANTEPIVSTGGGPVIGIRDNLNLAVKAPAIDTLSLGKDKDFLSTGSDPSVKPDVLPVINTNTGDRAIELLTRPVIAIPLPSGGGFPLDSISIDELTADMWCGLCKQRGNKECIAIHCSNDGTSTIISGINQPPLLSNDRFSGSASGIDTTLPDNMPSMLNDKIGFGSQINRHDLLQLTSVSTPHEHNVNNIARINQPAQETIRPATGTIAPIWLMADNVLGKAPGRPMDTVPNMMDTSSFVPPTVAELLVPVAREAITTNNLPVRNVQQTQVTITKDAVNPDILFIDGNIDNPLQMEKTQGKADNKGKGSQISTTASPNHNFNAQPLDIPTDIFVQMIRNDLPTFFKRLDKLQHTSFNKPSNTMTDTIGNNVSNKKPVIPVASDVFAKIQQGNTFGFPSGFVEDAVMRHQNDVTTTTVIPHIARAVDVFPIVSSDNNVINKQTLVVKDTGNTNNVPVHAGNRLVLDGGIKGHSSESALPKAPSLDLHSLLHLSNDHNPHHSIDVKTTTDHTQHALDHKHHEQFDHTGNLHRHSQTGNTKAVEHNHSVENAGHQHNSPIVSSNAMHPASALQHDIVALSGIHINGGVSEEMPSTTTPIPTIDPVRKATLNKFSEHLLSGIHL